MFRRFPPFLSQKNVELASVIDLDIETTCVESFFSKDIYSESMTILLSSILEEEPIGYYPCTKLQLLSQKSEFEAKIPEEIKYDVVKAYDERNKMEPELFAVHLKKLSEGPNSTIHFSQNIKTKEWIIIKYHTFNIGDVKVIIPPRQNNEYKVLKKLNQVIAEDLIDSQNKRYTLMPYFPGKDLENAVNSSPLSFSKLRFTDLILKMAIEIQKVHKIGILHNDIKPSNFLTNMLWSLQSEIIKLIDYGTSDLTENGSSIDEKTVLKSSGGDSRFRPPELIPKASMQVDGLNYGPVTEATEVYFFGRAIFAIFHKLNLSMEFDSYFLMRMEELLESMLNLNSFERPTLATCTEAIKQMTHYARMRRCSVTMDSAKLREFFSKPPSVVLLDLLKADEIFITDTTNSTSVNEQTFFNQNLLKYGIRIVAQPHLNQSHVEEMESYGNKALMGKIRAWSFSDTIHAPIEHVATTYDLELMGIYEGSYTNSFDSNSKFNSDFLVPIVHIGKGNYSFFMKSLSRITELKEDISNWILARGGKKVYPNQLRLIMKENEVAHVLEDTLRIGMLYCFFQQAKPSALINKSDYALLCNP